MNRCSAWSVLAATLIAAACSGVEYQPAASVPTVATEVTAIEVCSTCHGSGGNSESSDFPRLAGQQADYLVAQLTNFKGHRRSDVPAVEFMWPMSQGLTPAQIKELAAYFSRQAVQPNRPVDARLVASGKEIFEQGVPAKQVPACASCHGPKAEGLANVPRLANQHKEYLLRQLQVFAASDDRPGTPMAPIGHALSLPQMEAVASYLQAMPLGR